MEPTKEVAPQSAMMMPEITAIGDGKSTVVDSNIPLIAKQIFSGQPRPPYSCQLQLETDVSDVAEEGRARTIFEVLCTITLKGMRVCFGEDADPRRLSQSQVGLLCDYVKSMGWELRIDTSPLEVDVDSAGETDPSKMEFYKLRLIDESAKKRSDITFRPLLA